jgi:hypothetical protein
VGNVRWKGKSARNGDKDLLMEKLQDGGNMAMNLGVSLLEI